MKTKRWRHLKFAFDLALQSSLSLLTGQAEEFTLNLDQVVQEGAPGPGAGVIETVNSTDIYMFAATNGQNIFLEEIQVAGSFKGWLSWNLKSPGGTTLMSSYFEGNHEGRRVLPETGTYRLTVHVPANDPTYVGNYSFQVRSIPADDVFRIQVGDTISPGNPGQGAGMLEAPGAFDIYEFDAQAGLLAWFEELHADPVYAGWLQWELKAPSGANVFRSYLGGGQEGRKTLPETGTYRLSVFSGLHKTNHFGPYSFRIRGIPPDHLFNIVIGQTVTNGAPALGAGNIEVAGAQDYYNFEGSAGQAVFFEVLATAEEFKGYLHWEAKSPTGKTLFSAYMSPGSSVGRRTLPETGQYQIRVTALANDPTMTGTYAFRLLGAEDSGFSLGWGQVVAQGVPGPGAGEIEDAGGQDVYTVQAAAGQRISLEEITADPNFKGWLRWEVLGPTSNRLATDFLTGSHTNYLRLAEAGTHTIRIYAGANDPSYVGSYSFRVYSEVWAGRDQFGLSPTNQLVIPKSTLLCNDGGEPGDALELSLTNTASARGGTVSETTEAVIYTPPAGFEGIDEFSYRLRGHYGGEAAGNVQVRVMPDAEQEASVVSVQRAAQVHLCLFGTAGRNYAVETSTDLVQWAATGQTLTPQPTGAFDFSFEPNPAEVTPRYFRFKRQ